MYVLSQMYIMVVRGGPGSRAVGWSGALVPSAITRVALGEDGVRDH
jgi:hypothetical protein